VEVGLHYGQVVSHSVLNCHLSSQNTDVG
jgi:hypothetical protein